MARNRVIGRDNGLPWYLPADLRFFKRVTMGKPVIMGRKTYESIGRPLPGRMPIVVTRNRDYRAQGCTAVYSLDEALHAAEPAAEALVAGGAALYESALPRADRLYITEVDAVLEGDTYFPGFDEGGWQEIWREPHPADERHRYAYTFRLLQRLAD